jgi:hypothetical protein
MNLNCMRCGGLFDESNHAVCAGCSRPEHLTCGMIEPVWREGEVYFYFFCTRCNTYDDDEWEAQ